MSIVASVALAAAGLVALPQPTGYPDHWLGTNDIPKDEFANGRNGYFIFRALVTPQGKVERCSVLNATAPKDDWEAFCKRVSRRFGYRAVTDHEGAPAYYVLEANYGWRVLHDWVAAPLELLPDLIVEGQAVDPAVFKDAKAGMLLPVNVAIGAAGDLRQCNAAAGDSKADLVDVACRQLKAVWQPLPERNDAGRQVAYIRQMLVEFRAPAAG